MTIDLHRQAVWTSKKNMRDPIRDFIKGDRANVDGARILAEALHKDGWVPVRGADGLRPIQLL